MRGRDLASRVAQDGPTCGWKLETASLSTLRSHAVETVTQWSLCSKDIPMATSENGKIMLRPK